MYVVIGIVDMKCLVARLISDRSTESSSVFIMRIAIYIVVLVVSCAILWTASVTGDALVEFPPESKVEVEVQEEVEKSESSSAHGIHSSSRWAVQFQRTCHGQPIAPGHGGIAVDRLHILRL